MLPGTGEGLDWDASGDVGKTGRSPTAESCCAIVVYRVVLMKIAECLSGDEIRVVGECIDVVLSGALIDESEFYLRLGGTMAEVRAIRDCWMETEVHSKEAVWVRNILNDVGRGRRMSEEKWDSLFSCSRAEVRSIHGKIPRPPRQSSQRTKLEMERRKRRLERFAPGHLERLEERVEERLAARRAAKAARRAAKSSVSRVHEKDSAASREGPDSEPPPAGG